MPFPRYHEQETLLAFNNPQVGDCFTEMYSFYMYVIGVEEDKIYVIEGNPPCELPKDGILRVLTRKEFKKHYGYGTQPGFWVTWVNGDNDVNGWLESKGVHLNPPISPYMEIW